MAISIKKLEEKDNVACYLIKGTSPAFINAIRRSIMLHTACLAIEDVSIYENDSVMFDEFLAHRNSSPEAGAADVLAPIRPGHLVAPAAHAGRRPYVLVSGNANYAQASAR